jgi:hypothetical protein
MGNVKELDHIGRDSLIKSLGRDRYLGRRIKMNTIHAVYTPILDPSVWSYLTTCRLPLSSSSWSRVCTRQGRRRALLIATTAGVACVAMLYYYRHRSSSTAAAIARSDC